MKLSESTFLIYAASHYTNRSCSSTEEFMSDLNKIKYIKRLLHSYSITGVLKERHVLNHLITMYNVFSPLHCTSILFFKLKDYRKELTPFLLYLDKLPSIITDIDGEGNIHTYKYIKDQFIIKKLREIENGVTG